MKRKKIESQSHHPTPSMSLTNRYAHTKKIEIYLNLKSKYILRVIVRN